MNTLLLTLLLTLFLAATLSPAVADGVSTTNGVAGGSAPLAIFDLASTNVVPDYNFGTIHPRSITILHDIYRTNETWWEAYFPMQIEEAGVAVFRLSILATNRYINPPILLKTLPAIPCSVCGVPHHEPQVVEMEAYDTLTLEIVLRGFTNRFVAREPSTNWFATNIVARTHRATPYVSPPALPNPNAPKLNP